MFECTICHGDFELDDVVVVFKRRPAGICVACAARLREEETELHMQRRLREDVARTVNEIQGGG